MNFLQKLAIAFSAIFPTPENSKALGENPTENEVLTFLEKIPNLIQPLTEIKTIQENLQKVTEEFQTYKEASEKQDPKDPNPPGVTEERVREMITAASSQLDSTKLAQEVANKVYSAMADAKLITLTADGTPIVSPQLFGKKPPENSENSTEVTSKDFFGKRPSVGNLF